MKHTRINLRDHLRNHDWWYGMSDDHRYWRSGETSLASLRDKIKHLEPPWDLGTLKAWALGLLRERYNRPEDAKGQSSGWCYPLEGNGAPVRSDALITSALASEISAWMETAEVSRACLECPKIWTGDLPCPVCGSPGEPVED